MKTKYQSKYSAYSTSYEPRTAFGRIQKKIRTTQRHNIYEYNSGKCIKETYEINHQILEDMQRLHDKKLSCKDQREMINVLLQLKKGLKKMQEKARILNLDENTQIIGESNDDKIRKQVVLDLRKATDLIKTLSKFGMQMQ